MLKGVERDVDSTAITQKKMRKFQLRKGTLAKIIYGLSRKKYLRN